MFDLLSITNNVNSADYKDRCVVKLSTSYWHDAKGLHAKKSLVFLRRKCEGHNILEEDASCIGAEDVVSLIINLYKCEDGMYEVVPCNESRDWESGHIDYYEYKLIPVRQNE